MKNSLFKTADRKDKNGYSTNVNFRLDKVDELDGNGKKNNMDYSDPGNFFDL